MPEKLLEGDPNGVVAHSKMDSHGRAVIGAQRGFVRAAFEGMQGILGPLHEESYVLVHAADGDAYGYGGRTQNGRWAAAHPG